MLTGARQKLIEDLAARNGEVVVSALAKQLGVSVETIRRDITSLCEAGKLIKVHGGAVSATRPVAESDYQKRRSEGSRVKQQLGVYAAGLVEPNDVIAISTGSTMEAVAANLDNASATVITNSTAVASVVQQRCRCVLLGGQLHPDEGYTFGPVTTAQLRGFHTDKAFITASAVGVDGLMTTGIEEGDLARQMLETAAQVILVVQSTKIGARSVYRYAGLEAIDVIVTDDQRPLDPQFEKTVRDLGIKLHIV